MPFPQQLDPSYDASDAKAVKKAQVAAALRQDERNGITSAILTTPSGREWVWQILNDCHVFHTRIVGDSDRMNGFYEGQREVGLNLMRALCKASPENFATMLKENDNAS